MTRIIDFFLNRAMLVNLFSVMVIIMGTVSLFSLRKETFPNVDFDVITIRVDYPGSSAEDTEKLVSIEVERALKEVNGIKELNILSGEGYSITTIEVDTGYHVDEVLEDVRNAIDTIDDFPNEVEKPFIKKINNKQRAIFSIAVTTENKSEWELRSLSKKLRDYLELQTGVAKIELQGYRDQVVEVELDPKKLQKYELTLNQVSKAIADRNINLSAGTSETPEADVLVRVQSEYEDKRDVEKVVVRSNASGFQVNVSELGNVYERLKDDKVEERLNRNKTIFLRVVIKETADIIQTADLLVDKLDKYWLRNQLADYKYTIVDDMSFFVKRRLDILTTNGTQGMILVFLALVAFMNLRVSILTSLGAPIAFMVAFTAMSFFGLTINLISMFGLILVLGMLVDDSIIVAELFYQYVEKGMEPKVAARKAAIDTLGPVTATIITTVIAFGSLFFMGGIMGKFLWPVPATVLVCLAASWLECFFILPSHLADFTKKDDIGSSEKTKWYQPLFNFYRKILGYCLNYYKTTIAMFFLLLVGSVFLYKGFMRFELFPGDDVTVLFINLKAPVGTPIHISNEALKIGEEISLSELKHNELKNLRSVLGQSVSNRGSAKKGAHYGTIIYYLTMSNERERTTDQIMNSIIDKMKDKIKTHEVTFDRFQNGPPKGKPINIELSGNSIKELKVVSSKVREKISQLDGVISTELDFEEGKKQVLIDINEVEARRLGLSNRDIAFELRGVFEGLISTEIRTNDEDIDVVVRYEEKARNNLDVLDDIYILNSIGERIKLSQVASFEETEGAFVIRRYQRKRTISVLGEVDSKKISVLENNKRMVPVIEQTLESFPEVTYEISGEAKDTEESMGGLQRAALIALFGIFLVLVTSFSSLAQPLIIMSAIPMGLIGVIITFFVLGLPLSFMAFMGIVGLVGVVVNDSIVLVSFINEKISEGLEYKEAIWEGSVSRFRAVLLTTLTTSAGLLPIAHTSGGDPFLKPMATSFAYGLIFATTLTLLFVPCVYMAYTKVYELFFKKKLFFQIKD